jgi:hypothetical protein
MIGRVTERRATSSNPASRNAEAVPVHRKASGDSVAKGRVG